MEKGLKQFMIDYFTDQIHLKTSREKGFEEVEVYNHAINKIERSNQAVFHKYAAVVIETLRETPFFSEKHICQYEIVSGLTNMYSCCIEDYYQLLYEIYEAEIMSVTAYEILSRHFGEILARIFADFAPEEFNNIHLKNQMKSLLYKGLPEYVLKDILLEEFNVYQGDFYDEDERDYKKPDPNDYNGVPPWKNHNELECCVCHLEKKDYKIHSDVSYIAAFSDEEMNTFSTLIENMITFVNQDKRFEAVTYMIVDRKPYSSCEEMLKDIRYELFGYSKKDAERVVQMAKLIGRLGLNNEMLALKVIRLSKPVLDKGDLCYCQQFMMSD